MVEFTSSDKHIESELDKKLEAIGKHLHADVLTIIASMAPVLDDVVRDHIEGIIDKKENLLIILETYGGSIETVERIADLFRHHYPSPKEVWFLIPNFAMSAGTVLAMSGDKIYMDYYSILGPIDPQVRSRSKGDIWVPALGYLEKYNEFIEKSENGTLSSAEIAFFVNKFDPAELHQYEQARNLSIELLKKWLVNYKFKSWSKTETRGISVTPTMREERASEVAEVLNNVSRWKSHSRGLSMQVISNELKLQVDDFGVDQELNSRIRTYYKLLKDYMMKRSYSLMIHSYGNVLGV